jgi:hypothetical protein
MTGRAQQLAEDGQRDEPSVDVIEARERRAHRIEGAIAHDHRMTHPRPTRLVRHDARVLHDGPPTTPETEPA